MDDVTPRLTALDHDNAGGIEPLELRKLCDSTTRDITNGKIDTHRLDKCRVFVDIVNDTRNEKFVDEVRKLTYDALLFCSISFTRQSFQRVRGQFKARFILDYLDQNKISCQDSESKIMKRLRRYSMTGDRFSNVHDTLKPPAYWHTCDRARKSPITQMFTRPYVQEFEKLPHWGYNLYTSTMRMEISKEATRVVIDVPSHVKATSKLSELFQNPKPLLDAGTRVTIQSTRQLVIEMPGKDGAHIMRPLFQ